MRSPARTRVVLALAVLAALAALALPAAGHAQEAPSPRPGAAGATNAESHLFHVTLVAASREAVAAPAGELPPGVAAALADLRDFLPYRGYRVVDSALLRTTGAARARLAGPGGERYEAELRFRPLDGSFLVEHFALRKEPTVPQPETPGTSRGPALAPRAPEPALETSFRIARGETVVVGSSRLESGGGALIVLLTAAP